MEHWPNSSLPRWLLLENPWPAIGVMAAAAILLGWLAWRGRNRAMGIVAVILIGTGASLAPIARAIVTPRELLIQLTRTLVEAGVPPVDADMLERMLLDDVVFEAPANNPMLTDRASVIELARRAERTYRVQTWELAFVDAVLLSEDHAQSFVLVTTKLVSRGNDILAGFELGIPTEWLIDWRLTAEGRRGDSPAASWRVSRIVLRKIAGREAYPSQLP